MIRLVRVCGFLMIALGALILLSYLIAPLRAIWPWLLKLPLPIQIGLAVGVGGLILTLGSLLWERFEERDSDRALRDED
ncbi:MAG: hypothetical protein KC931_05860 [Candidatus Omnitrophica bacterium]|nr:hypothetical protein [Candidatus Omnitrophota bacterium]MCA9426194.1 hypothetical protein [Candidatus Omnitrophota bacterium]MCA9437474.1 hypothetical protein [Candidatus Omnitrophota bacterium]MCA9446619.1 hypothetical protein [Candidatus Omnitrophota bacterium]MCB9783706.1 hypothetical protein [Candidatus Omnitrophota bacterium]